MVRRQIAIMIAVIVFVIAVFFACSLIVSHLAASRYIAEVSTETNRLKSSFDTLVKSAEQDLFPAPDIPPVKRLEQVRKSQQDLRGAQDQLNNFNKENSALHLDQYVVSSSQYTKARAISRHIDIMRSQSQDVLDDYKVLLGYLEVVDTSRIVFEDNTMQVNSVANLEIYAGQGARVRSMGAAVQESLTKLRQVNVPKGLEESHNNMMKTFEIAAGGFSTFARGLGAASDGQIVAGVRQIEEATKSYESTNLNMLYDSIVQGIILQDVRSLPEKLEPLM